MSEVLFVAHHLEKLFMYGYSSAQKQIMSGIIKIFFELLQVAIGNKKTLSIVPTKEQWAELFILCKKQALVGLSFRGISSSSDIDETLYLKWLGMTAKVAQRNKGVNSACAELVKQYAHDGIRCCVLKGQGNLEYYPEELKDYRTAGDIDVWCKTMEPYGIDIAVGDLDGQGAHYQKYRGREAIVEYVRMLHRVDGDKVTERVRYHHIDAPSIAGVEVEAHFRPLFLDSPLRNCRLQRWFRDNEQFGIHDAMIGDCVIPTPTVSFNAVYQLAHIYRHLFDEGVGLRQLLDYYFVLRALHIQQGSFADRTQSMAQWAEGMGVAVKSNEEIMHMLSGFGMKKFAAAVMYVLQTVLDPSQPSLKGQESLDWRKRWPWMICEPDEKEGKFLLNEIMMAGNFGKYDDRIARGAKSFMGFKVPDSISHAIEKTKHNLRLLKHYPEEVLWEPFFRVYHWIWRKLELWRY